MCRRFCQRLCPVIVLGSKLESRNQMHERAQRHSRWAFCEPRFGVVIPCCASDVEVTPRRVTRKFADEPRACDRASSFAAADILNVCKTSLDEFAILIVH